MAKSFKDALLGAGMIRPEDTDEAKRLKAQQEREQKAEQALADRAADTTPRVEWEVAPKGRIVDSSIRPPVDKAKP